MSDWKQRLTRTLEPILRETDPRPKISAYHNMPYAIFRYPPDEEFALRGEITMLGTRLEQVGKRITVISLAACLGKALEIEGITTDDMKMTEKMTGTATMVDTVHKVLSEYQPLDVLVASSSQRTLTHCSTWSSSPVRAPCFRFTGLRHCLSSSRAKWRCRRSSSTRAISMAPQASDSWGCWTLNTTTDRRFSEGQRHGRHANQGAFCSRH